MKKKFQHLTLVCLSLLLLSSCSSDDDNALTDTENKLLGQWELAKIINGGNTINFNENCRDTYQFKNQQTFIEDWEKTNGQPNSNNCTLLNKATFNYTVNHEINVIKLTYLNSLLPYEGANTLLYKIKYIDNQDMSLVNIEKNTTLVFKKK